MIRAKQDIVKDTKTNMYGKPDRSDPTKRGERLNTNRKRQDESRVFTAKHKKIRINLQ